MNAVRIAAIGCPGCSGTIVDPEGRYCSRCGIPLAGTRSCGGCGAASSPEARFCHACGAALAEPARAVPRRMSADEVVPELEPVADLPPPGRGLTIEFFGQPEGRARDVLGIARAHPSYVQGQAADGIVHRVTLQTSEMATLLRLHDLLDGWAGRRVHMDGRKQDWIEFFAFLGCYKGRLASLDPDGYCTWDERNNLNLWGCFRTGLFFGDAYGASEWLSLGRFEKDNTFVFDKRQIVEALERAIAPFRLCPALDLKVVNAMLRVFPDRVSPSVSRDWVHLEASAGEGGHGSAIFRKDPTGERKVEVMLRGVRPASAEAAFRIFTDLRKRALALLERAPA